MTNSWIKANQHIHRATAHGYFQTKSIFNRNAALTLFGVAHSNFSQIVKQFWGPGLANEQKWKENECKYALWYEFKMQRFKMCLSHSDLHACGVILQKDVFLRELFHPSLPPLPFPGMFSEIFCHQLFPQSAPKKSLPLHLFCPLKELCMLSLWFFPLESVLCFSISVLSSH